MSPELQRLARLASARHGLPDELVLAVIETESGGYQYAHRAEPRWRYQWDLANARAFRKLTDVEMASETAPADFAAVGRTTRNTEWLDQQASWGLMQVMGAVARELGFSGESLAELVQPALNLDLGCRLLRRMMRFGSVERAVSAYNAGNPAVDATGRFVNQQYVDKVMAAHLRWQTAIPT